MNKIQRRALRNGIVAAALTALIGFSLDAALSNRGGEPAATATPTPSPTPTCTAAWAVVPSADPDPRGNQLLGISAALDDEVWAVGARGPTDAPAATLIERWDGTRWSVVPSPNGGTVTNVLRAVDATAPDDAWAVGTDSSGGGNQPLILHWDGASWAVSPVTYVTGGAALTGVAAIAPDDVWAVGSAGDPTAGLEQALALHWDGASWAEVPVHAGGGRSLLSAVAAVSATDVWAVGYHHHQPLAVHFDGSKWQPGSPVATGTLSAVTALAAGDVWAVGSSIQWWDGQAWSETGLVRGHGDLAGIAGVTGDDVWAVGSRAVGEATRALVQRFDGRRWSLVPGQGVPGSDAFTGVTALPDGAVWAVGYHDVAKGRSTLVARRAIACG